MDKDELKVKKAVALAIKVVCSDITKNEGTPTPDQMKGLAQMINSFNRIGKEGEPERDESWEGELGFAESLSG